MKKFIAVAGNIGVGKSTLVTLLCQRLGWQPFSEPQEENPDLADFYREMRNWSFHSQVFFLGRRLRAHRQLMDHPTSVIQDRSVYEDAEIFAANLYRGGAMSERDYATYRSLYEALAAILLPPDLVIYLQAPTEALLERIRRRKRDYERTLSETYVSDLARSYSEFFYHYDAAPLLIVNTERLNFADRETDFHLLLDRIRDMRGAREFFNMGA